MLASDALLRRLILYVAAPIAAGAGMAMIGPYGTYDRLALPPRLTYWILIVWANWLQVTFASRLLIRLLQPPTWPVPVAITLAACAASVLATVEVMALNAWLLGPDDRAPAFAELYFLVLLITLPATYVVSRLHPDLRPLIDTPATVPVPGVAAIGPAAPVVRFLDRLPAKLGRDLLCIRTEDHYLRVYTPLGDDLILMRMADAEGELTGLPGLRVHRSWWVARKAVASVEREAGGKLALVLTTGLRVPVARSALGALRAAGWTESG